MIKKRKHQIIIKFIVIVGLFTIVASLLLSLNIFGDSIFIKEFSRLLMEHTIFIYLINGMLFLLPAAVLNLIGKKAYFEMMNSDEDDINDETRRKAGYLDTSMIFLGVFTSINFMQFGMLYHKTTENTTTILALFMLGILSSVYLQVATVKYVQRLDSRLKGDPTKGTFNKEFLDSMDEAEQLKTFKSGYRSFQMTKTITQMIVVFSILMNIFFKTGGFAIFISSLFMIMQTVVSGYYDKNTK